MISIITAIHNQYEVNKLFLRNLEKNSALPYQLIIVDNHSTDGSADLFESHGATVIRNASNHCYPDSQNMGMQKAQFDYFAFLNNDICVAPDWDKHVLSAMRIYDLDVASLGGWEAMEDPRVRRQFHQRWKWLRKGKRYLNYNAEELGLMMDRLYPQSFEQWSLSEYQRCFPRVYNGIYGSAVVTTRKLWELIGDSWDPEMEASDFDLHVAVMKRAVEEGDVRPPMIIPWALHHHFSRLTFRANPEPRQCKHQHRSVYEKWSAEDMYRYGPKGLEDSSRYAKCRAFLKKFRVGAVSSRESV